MCKAIFLLCGIAGAALPALASECEAEANRLRAMPDNLVGFGRGATPEASFDAARVDLTKQLRVLVEGKSRLVTSKAGADFQGFMETRTNFIIDGAEAERQCQVAGEFQAVVVLGKKALKSNLGERMADISASARTHQSRVKAARPPDLTEELVEAQAFLLANEEEFERALSICRAYDGCEKTSRSDIAALKSLLRKHEKLLDEAHRFRGVWSNSLAREQQERLTGLVEDQGYRVAGDAPAKHVVRIGCDETVYPQIEGTPFQVVEVSCEAVGWRGEKKAFSLRFSGKGTAANLKEGRMIALERLERVKD